MAPEGVLNSFLGVVHKFKFSVPLLCFCFFAKAFRGDISVKLDTFSFGVVRLLI